MYDGWVQWLGTFEYSSGLSSIPRSKLGFEKMHHSTAYTTCSPLFCVWLKHTAVARDKGAIAKQWLIGTEIA